MGVGNADSRDSAEIEEPHHKGPLTSPFGRAIDRVSYWRILLLALLAVGSFSLYFWEATPHNQGIIHASDRTNAGTLPEAVYFTLVTFTTLGYGDINPIGMGRAVATIDVLVGLILFSLFIGKVASERQYSMLVLLHTSDCERRVQGFRNDLRAVTAALTAAGFAKDPVAIKLAIGDMADGLQALSNYVIFTINQSIFSEFGGKSSFAGLGDGLKMAQDACVNVFHNDVADPKDARRILSIVRKFARFERVLVRVRNRRKSRGFATGVVRIAQSWHWWKVLAIASENAHRQRLPPVPSILPTEKQADELERWSRTHVSSWLLNQVSNALPSGPRTKWQIHEHKRIAAKLGISNNLAQACIGRLIAAGKVL